MNILLVEDSATLRHAMTSYIKAAGHTAQVASSGEEALQMLEHQRFDLILMDVEMPGLNGFETTRLIREWLGDHWIPILFVTGKTDDASLEEGIGAGGDDYLYKPVSPIILKAKIHAMQRIMDMRDQLRDANEQLSRLNQRDGLTQLYNRATFNQFAQQQWQQGLRHQHPLSILMLDIDHFKAFNDGYGHPMGDLCLRDVATALQSIMPRAIDILARYGGEEFIALLPNTHLQGAQQVAERLRRGVEALAIPHGYSDSSDVVTSSIGVASCVPAAGQSLELLLEQADQMLYKSKQNGRNRVSISSQGDMKTILLVTRHKEELLHLRGMLHGQHTITAESDIECLELAQSILPHIILLDVEFAGIDPEAICSTLRQHPTTQDIPILLLANSEDSPALTSARREKADECLPKNLDAQRATALLNQWLLMRR